MDFLGLLSSAYVWISLITHPKEAFLLLLFLLGCLICAAAMVFGNLFLERIGLLIPPSTWKDRGYTEEEMKRKYGSRWKKVARKWMEEDRREEKRHGDW